MMPRMMPSANPSVPEVSIRRVAALRAAQTPIARRSSHQAARAGLWTATRAWCRCLRACPTGSRRATLRGKSTLRHRALRLTRACCWLRRRRRSARARRRRAHAEAARRAAGRRPQEAAARRSQGRAPLHPRLPACRASHPAARCAEAAPKTCVHCILPPALRFALRLQSLTRHTQHLLCSPRDRSCRAALLACWAACSRGTRAALQLRPPAETWRAASSVAGRLERCRHAACSDEASASRNVSTCHTRTSRPASPAAGRPAQQACGRCSVAVRRSRLAEG
jgi:hypothetical protein